MIELTPAIVSRFWALVDRGAPDACWNWKGPVRGRGYGSFNTGNRSDYTHRLAWIITYGQVLPGQVICHRCDNPACCNPAHLFIGSQRDNMRDMVRKGRNRSSVTYRPGSSNPFARLTESQVIAIRNRYQQGGITQQSLAREYGVSRPMIGHIIARRNWKHLPA